MNDLVHADCLDYLPTLPSNSIDLIIADPPYGNVVKENWDKTGLESYKKFTEGWLLRCHRVLKETGSIYVWQSLGDITAKYWLSLLDILSDQFCFKNMIIWVKQRARGNIKGWMFTREEILWATKDPKNYIWNKEHQYSSEKYHESWIKRLGKENNPYKRATNVWTDIEEVTIEQARLSGGRGSRKILHPTQKPLKAYERIVLSHTQPGDIVLDPFGGSGTTAVVCENLNRQYIVIEKDKTYYDIMVERLNGTKERKE